jgi:hypothetical protein
MAESSSDLEGQIRYYEKLLQNAYRRQILSEVLAATQKNIFALIVFLEKQRDLLLLQDAKYPKKEWTQQVLKVISIQIDSINLKSGKVENLWALLRKIPSESVNNDVQLTLVKTDQEIQKWSVFLLAQESKIKKLSASDQHVFDLEEVDIKIFPTL